VRLLSRPSKLFNERIIRPGINVVGREHTGVTAGGLHFGFEPLEVFTCASVVRENIDGLLDRNGPELLQSAPRTHPQIGRSRRQMVDEQEPTAMDRLDLWHKSGRSLSFSAWRHRLHLSGFERP